MYYFKYNDTSIEKYDVTFDKTKLMTLRQELINNYSEVVHREEDSIFGPVLNDRLKIRNCRRVNLVGMDEEGMPIYHYSYDEYKYPYIVTLIDRLLKKDDHALDEIFSEDLPPIKPVNPKAKKDILTYHKELISAINLELLDKIELAENNKKHNTHKIKTKKKYKNK